MLLGQNCFDYLMIVPCFLKERDDPRNETLYDATIKPCSWNIP